MPVQHNDAENLALQATSTLNRANSLGFLTDATVAAADTKVGLKMAIDAVVVHVGQENMKLLLKKAIDSDPNITDAAVLNLTTVAGLIALTGISTTSQAVLA